MVFKNVEEEVREVRVPDCGCGCVGGLVLSCIAERRALDGVGVKVLGSFIDA